VWQEFGINHQELAAVRQPIDSNPQPIPMKTDKEDRLAICAKLLKQKKFQKYTEEQLMLLSDPNLLFLQQGMKMEDRCTFLES
jgi:hypothetical protein